MSPSAVTSQVNGNGLWKTSEDDGSVGTELFRECGTNNTSLLVF